MNDPQRCYCKKPSLTCLVHWPKQIKLPLGRQQRSLSERNSKSKHSTRSIVRGFRLCISAEGTEL
jgi:hypothetical protein